MIAGDVGYDSSHHLRSCETSCTVVSTHAEKLNILHEAVTRGYIVCLRSGIVELSKAPEFS